MTDPTQTPADLERSQEFSESLHAGLTAFQIASLAALLRSVREEGARIAMEWIFGPDWRDTCCPHGFTLREDCGHEDGCESDALRRCATP